jgi:hypothetical protein
MRSYSHEPFNPLVEDSSPSRVIPLTAPLPGGFYLRRGLGLWRQPRLDDGNGSAPTVTIFVTRLSPVTPHPVLGHQAIFPTATHEFVQW